jgi:ribosomal protein S12 methylthiotransferase
LLDRLRSGIPGIAIRTTFIVGFPGETEEQFQSLLEFISRRRFERLGVFLYSQEDGSRAAKMENQIPLRTKNRRFREAMKLQQKIAEEIAREQIGRSLRVLVEQPKAGRSEFDAPDVDARVLLTSPAQVGEFVSVKITGTQVYDLVGEPELPGSS